MLPKNKRFSHGLLDGYLLGLHFFSGEGGFDVGQAGLPAAGEEW